ncbi:DUF2235 domain-containing protein [Achromobacter agilis]|uniref:T6SS Phospholipase effector Tle1-like catalytic domain-containing protein n=1 Tax=Achromobacter agilis TaxID=1353888 RepID=A0A446C9J1_9BURK|nr:DUF2235 domain-containing protein [Achromobacter agilis]SSW64506.1 hypothetical protein AGI3411_01604 [Achromobacter agilis]
MVKNLAVFFDGTWNEPNDRTNAYELYKAAPETSTQETLYIEGVGTQGQGLWAAMDRFMGGAFGAGLSANIRAGYRWLCHRHEPLDRIFLFGFSRGAYSARSLAGMVRKCGLLNAPSEAGVEEAYALYRDDCKPASLEATAFRAKFSRETDLHFVGVWDTVGSLGIPVGGISFPGFSTFYNFHDTELSNHVHHAYHAIAANEFREPYFPTLWTRLAGSEPRPPERPVEQRWFIGAHSDIGGGYRDGSLQTLPAAWLQEKAREVGLEAGVAQRIATDYEQCEPHDSSREFTQKVLIHVRKRPRQWDGARVLNLTVDDRLVKRFARSQEFLKEYPDFKHALEQLPVSRQ